MTPVNRNRLIGIVLAFAIFGIDQWLKHFVTVTLEINRWGEYQTITSFFDLRFTQNFGVSLGMFEATSPEMRWALVAVTGLIALIVTVWMLRETKLWDIIGLSLILGGALGNIRDRFELGYVVDYADLHFGECRPFLVFNLADAAISIGVAIILVRALLVRDKPTHTDHDDQAAVPAAETTQ